MLSAPGSDTTADGDSLQITHEVSGSSCFLSFKFSFPATDANHLPSPLSITRVVSWSLGVTVELCGISIM